MDRAETKTPAPESDVAALVGELRDYDAGLLNDYGAGNVDWWQDYIRAEIGRANDFWRVQSESILESLSSKVKEAGEPGAVAVKPSEAVHREGCEHAHSPIWLCDCPRPIRSPLLPAAALKGEAVAGDDIVARLTLGFVDKCWRELCERNEREGRRLHATMCLISDEELRGFMERARREQ
jgi:hypothetical protein